MPSTRFPTRIGDCTVEWHDRGLVAFNLPESPRFDTSNPTLPRLPSGDPAIDDLIVRVRQHLAGEPQDFADLRFDWDQVTDFRAKVLRAVLAVRPGTTATYGELAQTIGAAPGACRAIGGAVGANPWPLLVPCHRILGQGRKLTGYSAPGGTTTKQHLLEMEGVELLRA